MNRTKLAMILGVILLAGIASAVAPPTIPFRGGLAITPVGEPAIPPALAQDPTVNLQFRLVQFAGPIQDQLLELVAGTGVRLVQYIPHYSYVVFGNQTARQALETLAHTNPGIRATWAYHPYYRLEPSLQAAAQSFPSSQPVDVTVQLFNTANLSQSLQELFSLGGTVYRQPEAVLNFTNVSLSLPAGALRGVASRSDVYNVEPFKRPVMLDEVQGHIVAGNTRDSGGAIVAIDPSDAKYISHRQWLLSKGFPDSASSYPVLDVVDGGLDNGNTNTAHEDFYAFGDSSQPTRVPFITNCTSSTDGDDHGGHGTINASISGGYNEKAGWPYVDANGYRIGQGVNPHGRIAATKVFDDAGWDDANCGGNTSGIVQASYDAGADLTNNSWGWSGSGGDYNADAQAYDALTRDASGTNSGNQEMLHVFAAGNDGSGTYTVIPPGTAKNVLTVGATENVRDDGTTDGCGVDDAANSDDVAWFSSRGPCDDGRNKPDLMAPGTHVQGAASQDSSYAGTSVCDQYYPAAQTEYAWSSGTSHAAPAVAGAATLVYQHYTSVLAPFHLPTPAMTKALLINTARYLDSGNASTDDLPSDNQGWGGVDLGRALDGVPRCLLDQTELFDDSGESYSLTANIHDHMQPVRVTLAWTDQAGNTAGNNYVNDLDLKVTVGADTYRGNVFSGPNSVTGGAADFRNNVENVFLPVGGVSGSYSVEVSASNIAGDGVPGTGDGTDQDFALAVYNCVKSASPVVDVFIEDTPYDYTGSDPDDGTEPDPGDMASQDMWKSRAIWVRHAPDNNPTHENPEFGQTNYVYVNLKNDGPNATPDYASGVVKLYWGDASTGLSWPVDMVWFADVPVTLAPGVDQAVVAPWVPPHAGHFCLFAVWVSGQDLLSNAFTSSMDGNTRSNNNVAWRNVNVVDLNPDVMSLTACLLVRNISPDPEIIDLTLDAFPRPAFGDTFLDHGNIWIDLGPLFPVWSAAGRQGSGFQVVTLPGTQRLGVRSVEDHVLLAGMPMSSRAEARVCTTYAASPPTPPDGKFNVDFEQRTGGSITGGVSYSVNTSSTPPGPGTIPDNSLRVGKAGPNVVLTWQPSCRAEAENYAIYEGRIGTWYSHTLLDCSDDGEHLTETVSPSAGNVYFLVVPTRPTYEGSYGRNGRNVERPRGTLTCEPDQALTSCP